MHQTTHRLDGERLLKTDPTTAATKGSAKISCYRLLLSGSAAKRLRSAPELAQLRAAGSTILSENGKLL